MIDTAAILLLSMMKKREADASSFPARVETRVGLTKSGLAMLREHRSRRERWLADVINRHLSEQEQTLLFEAGALMERLALLVESSIAENDARSP